jgi:hypothetical protein
MARFLPQCTRLIELVVFRGTMWERASYLSRCIGYLKEQQRGPDLSRFTDLVGLQEQMQKP